MARKLKEIPHLRLRVEPSLLARLEKSAAKNGSTLTGEIIDRIESSFKRDDMQALMNETAQRISEKLLEATSADAIAKSQIIEEEMFELDLKSFAEAYPDTPLDEHARRIREMNARRHARRLARSEK